MTKVRVHELAKELNTNSKRLIEVLSSMGTDVKNHMSTLENDVAEGVRKLMAPGRKEHEIDAALSKKKLAEKIIDHKENGPVNIQQSHEHSQQHEHRTEVARQHQQQPQHHAEVVKHDQVTRNETIQHDQTKTREFNRDNNNAGRPQQAQQGGIRPNTSGQRTQYNGQRPQGEFRPQSDNRSAQGEHRPPQQGQQNDGFQRRPPMQQQGQTGERRDNRPPYQQDRRYPQQGQQQANQQQSGQQQSPAVNQQQRPQHYNNGPRREGDSRPQNFDRNQGQRPATGDRPQQQRAGGGFDQQRRDNNGNRPANQFPPRNKPFDKPVGDQQARKPAPRTDIAGAPAQKPEVKKGPFNKVEKDKVKFERKQITPAKQVKGQDKKPKISFEEQYDFLAKKKKPSKHRKGKKPDGLSEESPAVVVSVDGKLIIGETIMVKDLAEKIGVAASEVVKKLISMGEMAAINQAIGHDTAAIVAEEFGFEVLEGQIEEIEEAEETSPEEDLLFADDAPETLVSRPPIVTVMGHVDHGKTSLLDAIRQTNVTSSEAGGITQHIGAYQVKWNNRKITFLDTPGHEAFTAMRARGAKVTDIAVLVVAADDGVMPQTIEAIDHAKAAGVNIIVAVNKIDKPNAKPEIVLQGLSDHGLIAEEWGGETICVPVSAKQRTGIEDLLEMILLVADMHDMKANPKRHAVGAVIEAKLDKNRGPVATVLVQNGTLHVGDPFVVGTVSGRIRAMVNDKGERQKEARPSTPVEVVGLIDLPQAGDVLAVCDSDKQAKQIAELRANRIKDTEVIKSAKVTLDDLFKQISEGVIKELNIIIKADVQGSAEAVKQSLEKLGNKEVRVNVIHQGVGAISETDVMLASASNAIIIGFNVRPDNNARRLGEEEKIDMRMYRVIYDAIEDIRAAMEGMLEPDYKEVILGQAEVRQLIKVPKIGNIAGCYVTEGKIVRNGKVRVLRDGIVVHEGVLSSLKRFKDDVKEVAFGYECGTSIDSFNDLKEGDKFEVFILEEVKKSL